MVIVGVDPGLTGALAFIDTATGAVVIEDMPTKERETGGEILKRVDGLALATMVRRHAPAGCAVLSACENVRSFGRGDAARGTTVDALIGAKEAVLTTFDILRHECVLVEPTRWQRLVGLRGKKREDEERKQRIADAKALGRKLDRLDRLPLAVLKARALYPAAEPLLTLAKQHNRAEALLIAHYALRTFT